MEQGKQVDGRLGDSGQRVTLANAVVHDTVSALAESDASGVTAEVFADIRETMRIPMLTSIWRLLAESEDDLAASWNAVKPLYAKGQPEAALVRLRKDAKFPDLGFVTRDELESTGMTTEEIDTARNILAAYNRSNSLNLLTQTALVSERTSSFVEYEQVEPEQSISTLPPLLRREEITDSTWDVILKVNSFGTTGENPGLATIYRHLGYWPNLLKLMDSQLDTAARSGSISEGAESVIDIASDEGARMAHICDENDLAQMSDQARDMIAHYVHGPFNVARIVNIGTALHRWLKGAV